jgi:hypothetical protein
MSKYLRIISGVLTFAQLGWAAAIAALGGKAPTWALVIGAVVAAIGTAAPGILERMGADPKVQ